MLNARMRTRWRSAQDADCHGDQVVRLARSLSVHPIVARLLINRGFTEEPTARRFLNPSLTDLHDPALMPGADRAALRLVEAVRSGQPVVIYGDYDVDGITASAILYHTLRMADAQVYTYVPHRIDEGYGINGDALEKIARGELADGGWSAAGEVKPLVISVDCGITAVEPARIAQQLGLDLIITDHHEFDPANLPAAHTLVHPRINGAAASAGSSAASGEAATPPQSREASDSYPFGDLCGAGVAFKVAWQFARHWCGSQRLPDTFRELMVDLLSLAALGTVADVVPLLDENRILVRFGLGRIKHTRFTGLNALIDASRLRDEKIDAYHVGFVLGPRLNACGRMGHAARAVHLLTRANADEASLTATFLTAENERRRATERQIFAQAKQMVVDAGFDREDSRAIVLGGEGWHPGVLGIVASRLVEAFSRPVVMLATADGEAAGSARSVPEVSIHDALRQCSKHLTTFGGHAMAAGLRLPAEQVDAFRESLTACINAQLSPEELSPAITIDADCAMDDLNMTLFEQIGALAPFGRSNPQPRLRMQRVVIDEPPFRMGAQGQHLRIWLRGNGRRLQAVAFNMGDRAEELVPGLAFDVVFEPKVSSWQGQRRMELHLRDFRRAADSSMLSR